MTTTMSGDLWAGVTYAEPRPGDVDDEEGPWFCRNCGAELGWEWAGPMDRETGIISDPELSCWHKDPDPGWDLCDLDAAKAAVLADPDTRAWVEATVDRLVSQFEVGLRAELIREAAIRHVKDGCLPTAQDVNMSANSVEVGL